VSRRSTARRSFGVGANNPTRKNLLLRNVLTLRSRPNPRKVLKKSAKIFLVTGRGGLQGYKTSRMLHFLENQLTSGGEVVSNRRRPPFNLQESSWFSFLTGGGEIVSIGRRPPFNLQENSWFSFLLQTESMVRLEG
jgi:hypothetical protein